MNNDEKTFSVRKFHTLSTTGNQDKNTEKLSMNGKR